jgi:hypothetical protein
LCKCARTSDDETRQDDQASGVNTYEESSRNPAELWASAHATALYGYKYNRLSNLMDLIELHLVWCALLPSLLGGESDRAKRYAEEIIRDHPDEQKKIDHLAWKIERRTVWSELLCKHKQPDNTLSSRVDKLTTEANKVLAILGHPRIMPTPARPEAES